MEEKKYHIEESKIAGDKVCEPSPAYRSAASSASSASWDEAYDTDSYPIYFYNEEKDILWLVDLWDLRPNPRKLNIRARGIERKDYH